MRTRIFVAIAILTGAMLLPRTAAAQDYAPWLGTWSLNLARSSYDPGPPPYRRSTFTIALSGEGVTVVYDMVHVRGGITHLEWTGQFDARDYPVQGVEEYITYAYNRIDDRTYDIVVKLDGSVAATSRVVLSPDGRTITTITNGTNALGYKVSSTTVFDKQN